MTERSSEATSSRFTYDEPVSATKHDAATPDSPFGANRQVNGMESGKGRVTNNQTRAREAKGQAAVIIPEAADGQTQEPETSSSDTVTMNTANKQLITIPSMSRLNSQSTSTAQTSSPTTSSRRSSNHANSTIPFLTPTRPAPPSPISQPASRRGSRTLGSAMSTTSSTHATQRSPSHKGSTSSMRKAGLADGTRPMVVRRQSSLAMAYTAAPSMTISSIETGATDATEEEPLEKPLQVNGASSTTIGVEPISAAAVARKILDPLSTMDPPNPNSTTTTTSTDAPLHRNFSSTSASTSGASTTSSSSNPVLRHATELELAYGITPSNPAVAAESTLSSRRISRTGSAVSGTQTTSFFTRPRSIIQSLWGNRMRTGEGETDQPRADGTDANADETGPGWADLSSRDNVSNDPPPKHDSEEECGDIAWALANPIVVKDFAFEEGDERFDSVPPEALLCVLKPPKGSEAGKICGRVPGMGMGLADGVRRGPTRGKSNGLTGGGAHYGGAAHYGGRWGDDDFEEDEDIDDGYGDEEDEGDGWGFPMGTVSGGPAPLGTTLLGGQRSRRELKNRVRAWSGLGGSKGVGGRWVNEETSEAEGESSGFYEEADGVSGGEGISGDDDGEEVDPKDGDDAGLELDASALMHTPSKAYRSFIGDEEHVSGRVEPTTHTPASVYIPGSQLAYAAQVAHGGHLDGDGVDADDDEDDSADYDDPVHDRDQGGEEVRPGMYRAIFAFEAESPAEMSVAEGQMVRVVGRSGGGWVIAERADRVTGAPVAGGGEEHGLVPLGYLEPFEFEEADSDGPL